MISFFLPFQEEGGASTSTWEASAGLLSSAGSASSWLEWADNWV